MLGRLLGVRKRNLFEGRREKKRKKKFRFVLDAVVPLSKSYPALVAVVWELPFTRCRARILIHPENYSTVICLTTFAILRADRSLSSYLIIFPLFLSFSFLSPRSNRPSRASHERVARSCIAGDSDSSETRVDLQGRIFYRPCPRCFHEQRYPLAVVQAKISD